MIKEPRIFVASTMLGLGVAVCGYFIKQGLDSRNDFNRYVSVKGLAEKTVKADKAVWQLTTTYNADGLAAVYSGIATAQDVIKSFWIEQGFSSEDITLQPINVNDTSTYNANHGSRYAAQTSLILTSTDVDSVYAASQKMNLLAAKNIVLSGSDISYSFTKLNSIKPKMLDEATSNAETAAQAFAKNSKSRLNGLRNASQGQFSISNDDSSSMSSISKKVRVVTSVEYFIQG